MQGISGLAEDLLASQCLVIHGVSCVLAKISVMFFFYEEIIFDVLQTLTVLVAH